MYFLFFIGCLISMGGIIMGSLEACEGGLKIQNISSEEQKGAAIIILLMMLFPAIIGFIACFAELESFQYGFVKGLFIFDAVLTFLRSASTQDNEERKSNIYFFITYAAGAVSLFSFVLIGLGVYAPFPLGLWKVIDLAYAIAKLTLLF